MEKRSRSKRFISVLLVVILVMSWSLQVIASEPATEKASIKEEVSEAENGVTYAPDEILVMYRYDVSDEEAEKLVEIQGDDGIEILAQTEEGTIATVQVSKGSTVEEAVDTYCADNRVIAATPNYEVELFADTTVNDTHYSKQSYLSQTNVPQAWNLVNGIPHQRVRVAVLDTGADISHPDLRNILNLRDSREILDSSGRLGPLQGDGFQSGQQALGGGHGTHVAGIIASEANNKEGVAGVASAIDNSVVDLIAVDVFSSDRTTYLNYVIKGMEYAKKAGAKVVNLSLGMKKSAIGNADEMFQAMCRSFADAGIILVCAAGNDGDGDNGSISTIPSDYDSTISVISLNGDQKRAETSNYGTRKDISTPGVNIYNTTKGGGYGALNGTSMAAAEISGIVALMCSLNPNLTVEEVRQILTTTATDIGAPGFDPYTAAGRVNAQAAIEKVIENQGTGASSLPYSDVKSQDWYFSAASFMYENKIMTGMTPTLFAPGEKTSRAQFATILFRASGESSVQYSQKFPDVPQGEFYTDAVLWAADKGIITGYENGTFGPTDVITREQMAVILYRYIQYQGHDTSNRTSMERFPDSFKISDFAKEGMAWAVAEGIISGNKDGTLAPRISANRAECATMMTRFLKKYFGF